MDFEVGTEMERPELLTVLEVAGFLRVSRATVYRLIHDGDLQKIKCRSRTLFETSAVEALVRRWGSEAD
jgi:excisionase family DNA binding protein